VSDNWVDDVDVKENPQEPSRVLPIVMLCLIAVLIGTTLFLFLELRSTQEDFTARLQTQEEQMAQMEGALNRMARAVDMRVEELKGVVETAEQDLTKVADTMEKRVTSRTRQLESELNQQEQEISQVGGTLSQLKQETSTAGQKINSLTGRVEGVKSTVEQTSAQLENTIKALNSVKGDLGVQSGLIATNAEELEALKRLGERNFYEFDISKRDDRTRVGSIQIELKKTKEDKNMYRIDVWADDRRIRKKNRSLLEPVQFYVRGSRVPYEIVVNEIHDDRIVGYLATPKDEPGRRDAPQPGS